MNIQKLEKEQLEANINKLDQDLKETKSTLNTEVNTLQKVYNYAVDICKKSQQRRGD